jgi:hypothetical protein
MVAILLLFGCGGGGILRDWNEDGVILVACGGDSNTARRRDHPSWCGYLHEELPKVRTRQAAWGGSEAVDDSRKAYGGRLPSSSAYYVNQMLAWRQKPDVAILAWGTNDLILNHAPAEVVAALTDRRAVLRAAGLGVLVATVPYMVGNPAVNHRVDEVNALFVSTFGPCIVDFNAASPPSREFYMDDRHVNDVGQRARAQRAAEALRNAARRCGP